MPRPLVLWTLRVMMVMLTVSSVGCYRPRLTENVLWDSQEATSSVLLDSWIPGCSIVYVTDGSMSSTTLRKVLERVGLEPSVGIFETPPIDNENATFQLSRLLPSLHQIRKTSRCTTLVVAIENIDYLITFVLEALNDDLLIWPTRLLVVTKHTGRRLLYLSDPLSALNAMVITLEETLKVKRCGVYAYLPYSKRKVLVAMWTPNSGLVYFGNGQLFPDKFRRLTDGADLVVVGQHLPPHLIVRATSSGGDGEKNRVQFNGPVIMLLGMLAKDINFTYSLIRPYDGKWGYLLPNGTWDGMIGMLVRKDVDFALGPLAITYLRSRAIDFTSPLVVDYGRILGRRGDTEVNPWSFALPLTHSVWASTFVTFLLVIFIVQSMTTTEWNAHPLSPKISLATYIRAFFQQDITVESQNQWEKILLGFWMLFVFIIIECYSTNLTSLLAVRHISEPYQTVRDMVDDPKVTMIWFANTAYIQYLTTVESGIFYDVAQAGKQDRLKLISPVEYASTVGHLVSRGDHVMINPLLMMKMFLTEDHMDKGNCKFYVSREEFLPYTFCMIVQKHSPLRGPINEGIRAVVEGGIYNYWLDNSFSNARSCKNPPTKITVKASLSLTNVWGIFVVLVAGYVISFISLFLEMASSKIQSRSHSKTSS